MIAWSYSSYKVFKTCARQYKHKYILKDITEPQGDAAKYGTAVHLALENFLKDGTPIPDEYARFKTMVEPVQRWAGDSYVEHKMAIGSDFRPCEFKDKNYFVRGVADFIKVDGTKARCLDWKTGSSAKFADTKQLELMALMIFKHFPKVDTVTAGLCFLKIDKVIKATYRKKDAKAMWLRWLYEVSRIEHAVENDMFGPNPNNLCKNYCYVKSCEHCGT